MPKRETNVLKLIKWIDVLYIEIAWYLMHSREIFQRPRYIFMFIISLLFRSNGKSQKKSEFWGYRANSCGSLEQRRSILCGVAHPISYIFFIVVNVCAQYTIAIGICGTRNVTNKALTPNIWKYTACEWVCLSWLFNIKFLQFY